MTANLYTALHQLMSLHSVDMYWWIDALCINHSSSIERTAQVSIMYKIFRTASTVVVWLGPDPSNEVYSVREFFRALLAKYVLVGDNFEADGPSKYKEYWLGRGDDPTYTAAGLPPLQHEMWSAVVRFWTRSWFHRAWVKQEVALAAKVEVWCSGIQFEVWELVEA